MKTFIMIILLNLCLLMQVQCLADEALMYGFDVKYELNTYDHSGNFNYMGVLHESDDWRELILPQSGLYSETFPLNPYVLSNKKIPEKRKKSFKSSYLTRLPKHENELIYLLAGGLAPVFACPILAQYCKDNDSPGKYHIESLCVIFQEFGSPPIVTHLASAKENMFCKLATLSHLKHLELFSFGIDKVEFDKIKQITGLNYLGLPMTAKDCFIDSLTGFKKLSFLNMSNTKVKGGESFKKLALLPSLRTIDLSRTAIGNDAVNNLTGIKGLESLLLAKTKITDDAMSDIAKMEKLRYLAIHETSISDKGIKQLCKLNNLEILSVYNTKVTMKGLQELRKSNLGLVMQYDEPQTLDEYYQTNNYIYAIRGNDSSLQKKLLYKHNITDSKLINNGVVMSWRIFHHEWA